MSLLSELTVPSGSKHKPKRLGRGIGSGKGGTAGKGHKGQKARSGGTVRRGFEGGQMPLHRRMPKVGFVNKFRSPFNIVNLSQLEGAGTEFTPESLRASKLVRREGMVKVLGDGKISKAIKIKAHRFSKSAKAAIEAAGGVAEVIS